mmetsp:Transcript_19958/g.44975  ORF Transcript_19958/g.44975 Transcript_19958/m.44975 type:complete len:303 (-) Transcript_19958:119-1027(-)
MMSSEACGYFVARSATLRRESAPCSIFTALSSRPSAISTTAGSRQQIISTMSSVRRVNTSTRNWCWRLRRAEGSISREFISASSSSCPGMLSNLVTSSSFVSSYFRPHRAPSIPKADSRFFLSACAEASCASPAARMKRMIERFPRKCRALCVVMYSASLGTWPRRRSSQGISCASRSAFPREVNTAAMCWRVSERLEKDWKTTEAAALIRGLSWINPRFLTVTGLRSSNTSTRSSPVTTARRERRHQSSFSRKPILVTCRNRNADSTRGNSERPRTILAASLSDESHACSPANALSTAASS